MSQQLLRKNIDDPNFERDNPREGFITIHPMGVLPLETGWYLLVDMSILYRCYWDNIDQDWFFCDKKIKKLFDSSYYKDHKDFNYEMSASWISPIIHKSSSRWISPMVDTYTINRFQSYRHKCS